MIFQLKRGDAGSTILKVERQSNRLHLKCVESDRGRCLELSGNHFTDCNRTGDHRTHVRLFEEIGGRGDNRVGIRGCLESGTMHS